MVCSIGGRPNVNVEAIVHQYGFLWNKIQPASPLELFSFIANSESNRIHVGDSGIAFREPPSYLCVRGCGGLNLRSPTGGWA